MQHWLWGEGDSLQVPVSSPTGRDLHRAELLAVLIFLVWLGLIASGWLATSLDAPAAVTRAAVCGGVIG